MLNSSLDVLLGVSFFYLGFLCVQVQYILSELCLGGMVAETNMVDILSHYTDQEKFERQEVGGATGRLFATRPRVASLPAFVVDFRVA